MNNASDDPTKLATALLTQHARTVEAHLERILVGESDAPPQLIEGMRYSLLAGGKRLRPALVLETFAAVSDSVSASESSALAAACAMELIHTFSLVHDDLPAMDDDDLRRGRPTNHKVFGEAMAILAGDAMITLAFELIAREALPNLAPRLIVELAQAAGPVGMIGGQALDLASERQALPIEALQNIHRRKTGALLTASCRLGAISASASDEVLAKVTEYGRHLGLAFQIVDDILDITSTREQLGKATNKDAGRGKNTYPALIGLDESRKQAQRQVDEAIQSLGGLSTSADGLRQLARLVIARQS